MITVTDLQFGYGRRAGRVFEQLNLRFEPGRIHGLLGSNGVGKSTLLKLLCGLLRPTRGRVCVDGFDPAQRSVELLTRLQLLPEEVALPDFSIAAFARCRAPFYPAWSAEQFRTACDRLEVDPKVPLRNCSMGSRRKALIAFVLACNTPILLLDEPTNGLDIPSKGAFRRLLAEYISDERMVILSTHSVREVESLIDSVTICSREGVILQATVADIAARLHFGAVDPAKAIYAERRMGQSVGLAANDDPGRDTPVDLELLFNAALHDPRALGQVLNPSKSAGHESLR